MYVKLLNTLTIISNNPVHCTTFARQNVSELSFYEVWVGVLKRGIKEGWKENVAPVYRSDLGKVITGIIQSFPSQGTQKCEKERGAPSDAYLLTLSLHGAESFLSS